MPHDQIHDLASAEDHTGEITDAQHGSRGAGTLHPAATPTQPGFMSAVDKAKLDTVKEGALTAIIWHLGDNNGPGAGSGSSTPKILRYSVYTGTDNWTPNLFAVLGQTSNASRPVAFDIYDVTNGQVLATVTGVLGTVPTLYSTSTITNLPTGIAVIALRAYWTGQAAVATAFAAYFATA